MSFIKTIQFQTGTFLGFTFTAIIATYFIVEFYTSNDLLRHNTFYKDGKEYKVVEKRKKCD